MDKATDGIASLLLKFTGQAGDDQLAAGLASLAAGSILAPASLQANRALALAETYVYAELAGPAALSAGDIAALVATARGVSEFSGLQVTASRLLRRFDRPGVSAGEVALFHYCVEFDPAEGWEADIASWYDTEHMPGLAAVTGCVRAQRFVNLDAGPSLLACYDLVSPAARETKAWQEVVATPWSSRVRPNFQHTKRTLFARTPLM
jgi:hypothetical protein